MSSDSSSSKTIVVFGATGNIGVPLVEALSQYNTHSTVPAYNILALSRNPDSETSKKLSKLPGVRVVKVPENNMDEPLPALAEAGAKKGEVYGMFSVQGYVSYQQDIAQGTFFPPFRASQLREAGKAIADAAKELGVQHFVYLSTDFGGSPNTHADPLERKRVVETYIRTLDLPYTFLHPAQFMDNLLPTSTSFMRLGRTMLIRNTFKSHPERKHQMVSALDIGRAGALAFHDPDTWRNRDFPLAGDEFTMLELLQTYREVMGMEVDTGNSWITGFARAVVPAPKKLADVSSYHERWITADLQFFDQIGYSVDIEQCRRDLPGVESLRTFLERFRAQQARN